MSIEADIKSAIERITYFVGRQSQCTIEWSECDGTLVLLDVAYSMYDVVNIKTQSEDASMRWLKARYPHLLVLENNGVPFLRMVHKGLRYILEYNGEYIATLSAKSFCKYLKKHHLPHL